MTLKVVVPNGNDKMASPLLNPQVSIFTLRGFLSYALIIRFVNVLVQIDLEFSKSSIFARKQGKVDIFMYFVYVCFIFSVACGGTKLLKRSTFVRKVYDSN